MSHEAGFKKLAQNWGHKLSWTDTRFRQGFSNRFPCRHHQPGFIIVGGKRPADIKSETFQKLRESQGLFIREFNIDFHFITSRIFFHTVQSATHLNNTFFKKIFITGHPHN